MVDADRHVVMAALESARRTRDQAANELVLAQRRLEEAERELAKVKKTAREAGL